MLNDDSLHRRWGDGGGMERRDEEWRVDEIESQRGRAKVVPTASRLSPFSGDGNTGEVLFVVVCLLRHPPPVSQAGSTHFIRPTS